MGLQRVHRTDNSEPFGPVRLGPQDLRDIAAVFEELKVKIPPSVPSLGTKFRMSEHQTDDVEDVLSFADADTISSIHIMSGELRLGFHAGQDATIVDKPLPAREVAHRQAIEEAAQKLRQIIQARQLRPLEALRQRGPTKRLLAVLVIAPALLLVGGQRVLDLWLTSGTSQAVAGGLIWLSLVPLLVMAAARPRDLIRLRGQQQPWWERRLGLIALLGVVVAIVIPVVIFALESERK